MGRTPGKQYSQAERVLRLYDRLRLRGGIRVSRDSDELGVSRRTLERDLAVLRSVLDGRLSEGDEDEHRVVRLDFEKEQLVTAMDQLFAVELGARLAGFVAGPSFAKTVDPTLDALRNTLASKAERRKVEALRSKIVVMAPGEKRYDLNARQLEQLRVMVDGLVRQAPVQLAYQSHTRAQRGAPPRQLRVHPLALVLYRGGVYFQVEITGGDTDHLTSLVQLALDRMAEATPVKEGGRFEVPEGYDPRAMYADAFGIFATGQARDVTLRVSPRMAPYVRERTWRPSQVLEDEPDGGMRVTLRVAGDEVLDWVLTMGPDAEVLAPPELRTEVQRRLAAALRQYEEGGGP